jgi:putative ABC transport system permease protein
VSARRGIQSPGYFVAATTTLALAIAAAGAIIGAVHGLLLGSIGIQDPARLVIAWETHAANAQAVVEVSYRNFTEWRASSRSFTHVAAVGSSAWSIVLDAREDPVKLASTAVSGSFFDTLGARPHIGRLLQPDDDRPGQPRLVVLSHRLWQQRFGSDAAMVGRVIHGDGVPATVVGVASADFDYPRGTDLWMPVAPLLTEGSATLAGLTEIGVLFVIGRLSDGVTPAAAAREMDDLARRFQQAGTYRFGTGVHVKPFLDHLFGPVRAALWWLLGAVIMLLVIACGNLSALSLTQALRHKRQRAIRIALGATRAALWRPLLIESSLIALAAAALGLIAARTVLAAVVMLAPDDVPHLDELSMTWPVALVTIAVSFVVALVGCLVPALRGRAVGRALVDDLHDTAHATESRSSMRTRSLLLRGQIALTVVLLAATGLMFRSYTHLLELDLGFDPERVVTMEIEPQQTALPPNEWMRELLSRVHAMEGVEAAGAVYLRPLALGAIGADSLILLEGQTGDSASTKTNPHINYQVATPGYFRAMNIALKQGRLFGVGDHGRSPRVVLVGESTARRLWPGEDPIGRRLALPSMDNPPSPGSSAAGSTPIWRTVVGVVSDVRYRGLEDVRFDIYDPASQARALAGHLVVRSAKNPVALAAAISAEARRMDPRALVGGVTTMEAVISRTLAAWRLSVWMFAAFALMALVLACAGLFGVAALDHAQRAREFALRLALGAETRDIARKVLTSVAQKALPGVVVGLGVAAAASQWMSSLLFRTHPLDPFTYAGVVLAVLVSVALAGAIPAYRASQTDPATLLKSE